MIDPDVVLTQNSDQSARPRGPGRPFPKGVSGNPGGRPKEIGHVRDLARKHTAEAIRTLVDIMETGKTDSARAAAASELLSRAWGKPSMALDHTVREEPFSLDFSSLTEDEKESIRSIAAKVGG